MAGLNETYFLLIPTLVQTFKTIHSRKFWKVQSVFLHIVRRDTLRTIWNNYDIWDKLSIISLIIYYLLRTSHHMPLPSKRTRSTL